MPQEEEPMRDVEKTRWGKGWEKVRQSVSDPSRKWSSVDNTCPRLCSGICKGFRLALYKKKGKANCLTH